MAFLTTLTADDVRECAPHLYAQIVERETGRTVREADGALSDEEIERQVRNDPRIQAAVREHEELLADQSIMLAKMDEMAAERNRDECADFIVRTIREAAPGLTTQQVEHIALRDGLANVTCGDKGTYADAETLGRVVREATQEFVAALGPAGQRQARQQRRSGEIAGLGGRSGVVREASAARTPRTVREAVEYGLALDFGRNLLKPVETQHLDTTGAVREAVSARTSGSQAGTVQDGVLAGLALDWHN